MALTNSGDKTKNLVSKGKGEQTVKERREKKRKRKRRRREAKQAKVWKLTLILDSMRLCMNFHAWLVSSLSPNLGFC